jgi:hypothetical protein
MILDHANGPASFAGLTRRARDARARLPSKKATTASRRVGRPKRARSQPAESQLKIEGHIDCCDARGFAGLVLNRDNPEISSSPVPPTAPGWGYRASLLFIAEQPGWAPSLPTGFARTWPMRVFRTVTMGSSFFGSALFWAGRNVLTRAAAGRVCRPAGR